MKIIRNGERPTTAAPASYFTGTVIMDPIIEAPEPASIRALKVTFLPGARTNWHHHPVGQTLYVLEGEGRIAMRGGPVEVIRPGDTVWIPPDLEHWHGAGPGTRMTHVAMQEEPGRSTVWLEPVSDTDYGA